LRELAIRFLIGGFVVSGFALISDLFKPKTFAGLFGAAPSVALASIGITVLTQGKQIATSEARSMILGAVALFFSAAILSRIVLRFRLPALPVFLPGVLLWIGVAVGLWFALLST
jgi:hypothetical protein